METVRVGVGPNRAGRCNIDAPILWPTVRMEPVTEVVPSPRRPMARRRTFSASYVSNDSRRKVSAMDTSKVIVVDVMLLLLLLVSFAGNLKTHIRSVHTKEKPFTCHVCGKSFSQKGNMMTHVRTHNKDDRFPCHLCGKTFSQKGKTDRRSWLSMIMTCLLWTGNLKTHMQRHSGNPPPPTKRSKKPRRNSDDNNSSGGGGGGEMNGSRLGGGALHYGQPLDLVGPGGRSSPGSSDGAGQSSDDSSHSPLSEIGQQQSQHLTASHIPFPGGNGRLVDKGWPVNACNQLLPPQAAAVALYSSPMAWPIAHKNGGGSNSNNTSQAPSTASAGSHPATSSSASSSSQQHSAATNNVHHHQQQQSHHQAAAAALHHHQRTPSQHPNPYDHFSTLAAAAAASNHPAYSSFAAGHPLSRLSLFQGMAAAGMHAGHLAGAGARGGNETPRPESGDTGGSAEGDSPRSQSESPGGGSRE